MKQSTFAAIIVFLAAATGALAAAWMYIRRREKELDEYEQLLFSEDFDEEPGEPAEAEARPQTAQYERGGPRRRLNACGAPSLYSAAARPFAGLFLFFCVAAGRFML